MSDCVVESVGGIFETDSYDWSNGIRYRIFDTRHNTELNSGCDRGNHAPPCLDVVTLPAAAAAGNSDHDG
jgi:hypothetical protein